MEREGVIKYTNLHEFKEINCEKQALFINKVRVKLHDKGYIGEDAYTGIGYGNISIRLNKKEFLITGSQTGKLKNLSIEHFSIINDYDFESFTLNSFGHSKPSSESFTHAALYSIFKDVTAIIHIHSMVLWEEMLLGGKLATREVEYGTKEMILEVKRIFSNNKIQSGIFAMKGHPGGIISFGENMDIAYNLI